jgi:hypothetical protein
VMAAPFETIEVARSSPARLDRHRILSAMVSGAARTG